MPPKRKRTPPPPSPPATRSNSESKFKTDSKKSSESDGPEPQPEKKNTSISKKSSSSIHRLWSLKDEITLIQALLDYKAKNGQLPTRKELPTFLASLGGSISFAVTENQLFNKIRSSRFSFGQKKKGGYAPISQNSHDAKVFEMCEELFGDDGELSKKQAAEETDTNAQKMNRREKMGASGSEFVLTGGTTSVNNGKLYCYLNKLISMSLSIDDVMERVEESSLQEFEARAKELNMNIIKLRAKEAELVAEVLGVVAGEHNLK